MTDADIREILYREGQATPGPWEWAMLDDSMMCLGTVGDAEGMGAALAVTRCDSCRKHGTPERLPCFWPNAKDAQAVLDARNVYREALEELLVLRALTGTQKE